MTVYNSINCGSYWQAFALGEAIRGLGHDVVYWKRDLGRSSSASLNRKLKKMAKCFLHGGIKGAISYRKALQGFLNVQQQFAVTSTKNDIDCFVLGSDTIWNVANIHFKSNYKTYWGIEFFPAKVISYAASAANTGESDLTEEMYNAVRSLSAVSVRDLHTLDLIHRSKESAQIVCDPTMLLKKEAYQQYMAEKRKERYVFLYLFSELKNEITEELKAFCDRNNLLIVNGWYPDTNVRFNKGGIVSPTEFITELFNAEYVVTDTFHGTAFSILFNKQFVSVKRNQNKVIELLKQVGLETRFIDSDLEKTLTEKIDYDKVNQTIDEIRAASADYLKNGLLGDE